MNPLRFPVSSASGRTSVRLEGEVDVFSAGRLRQALDTARHARAGDIDVVARDVTFMDSAALGVLVHAQRELRSDGRVLRVVEPSPTVARLLQVAGATRLYGETGPLAAAP